MTEPKFSKDEKARLVRSARTAHMPILGDLSFWADVETRLDELAEADRPEVEKRD